MYSIKPIVLSVSPNIRFSYCHPNWLIIGLISISLFSVSIPAPKYVIPNLGPLYTELPPSSGILLVVGIVIWLDIFLLDSKYFIQSRLYWGYWGTLQ